VPKFLLPGANPHIKLSKARSSLYLMNATADSKTTFKFLDENYLLNASDITQIFYRLKMNL